MMNLLNIIFKSLKLGKMFSLEIKKKTYLKLFFNIVLNKILLFDINPGFLQKHCIHLNACKISWKPIPLLRLFNSTKVKYYEIFV